MIGFNGRLQLQIQKKNIVGQSPKKKSGTPETRFSEPQFSEILDLMNKLQLPFSDSI